MTFVLTGPRSREAFDKETGIRIKSLGANGPEIENSHWQGTIEALCFSFTTRVADEGDEVDGRRRIWVSPSLELIEYLRSGADENERRMGIIDRMLEGIIFMIPIVHFKSPMFLERRAALTVRRIGDRVAFESVDAPGLWDVGSAVR